MTGNKGEWSEFYALIKLLADKKIFAADPELQKINTLFFPVLSVIREESGQIKEYKISESGQISICSSGQEVSVADLGDLNLKATKIFAAIKAGSETFSIPLATLMMQELDVASLKAGNAKKEDITLRIHDLNTNTEQTSGFSIKSMLGSPATLLNSSTATNFKFKIVNCSQSLMATTNAIDTKAKVKDRISYLRENDCTLKFVTVSSDTFSANLSIIDTILPLIVSEFLLAYYSGNGSLVSGISDYILQNSEVINDYNMSPISLKHKIKSFLHAIALGMVPATAWDGEMRAHGGYIIIREDGELVCYHVYNADQFREYLYRNVKFDSPSVSRHGYGSVYKEGDDFFINLNMQIRFIK